MLLTIHIEPASVIVGFLLAGMCLVFNEMNEYRRDRKAKKAKPEKTEEIFYPLEPMFENYCSIREDIINCMNQKDINLVYVRIIIFESCYTDSASYTSELMHAYQSRENEIKSSTL